MNAAWDRAGMHFNTWQLLQYAARMDPSNAPIEGRRMRSARILERRGLLTVLPRRRPYVFYVRLTDAGRETAAAFRGRTMHLL
jgi:hypothetical protein